MRRKSQNPWILKILRGEDVTNLIEHVKSVYENDIKDKGDSPIEFIQEEPIKVKTKVEVKNDENTEDTELVKQFKTLRLKLAKEHKMYPLYNVYNNAMIDDVITANPQTKEALANVKGFGPLKVKLFGDAIVKLLKENFDTSNDVTVDNDNDLFQKLIAERAKISKFNKIPVEAIYSDQVAKNLAKMKPKKIEHLDKIFGFDKKT